MMDRSNATNHSYSLSQDGAYWFISDNGSPVMTPGGRRVETLYRPVALRLVSDLERFGMRFSVPGSSVPWHFAFLDSYGPMGPEKSREVLEECFLEYQDWSFEPDLGDEWERCFGTWPDRKDRMAEWLGRLDGMQLTAAGCIGNAYHSLNLAYTLAVISEGHDGPERPEQYSRLADLVSRNTPFFAHGDMEADFRLFDLYYNAAI